MRDVLMEREPKDWDIATSALPNAVVQLFPRVVPTGIQHGTVTVVMFDGNYEVTVFRGEGAYSDGRRPDEIYFLDSVEKDLARRDFTINAIAGNPLTGEIIDPYDGRGDIERRVIRAVGNPNARFAEDGLRVLRAARFAAMLEFDLDPETALAIPLHLRTFAKVAVERKFDEIAKMLVRSPHPSVGLEIMLHIGLLAAVVPELMPTVELTQNKYHQFDVFGHTLFVVDDVAPQLTLRLAALLHDSGKPKARAWNEKNQDWTFYDHEDVSAKIASVWLKRMKVSTELHDEVVALVQHHLVLYSPSWTDAAVRRWVKRVGPCRVHTLLELARADARGQGDTPFTVECRAMVDELQERVDSVMAGAPALDVCGLAVTGEDIMRVLNVQPGRIVGQVKNALLEIVLEQPELNTRETLEMLIPEVARKVGS
jgi:tRNA nucleotidyltransferase (CCA-adding enzyme)